MKNICQVENVLLLIICVIIWIIEKYHEEAVIGKKYILIFIGIQILGTILMIAPDFGELNIFREFIGIILVFIRITFFS